MNYYRRYIGDYQRDTQHLTLAEHGVYTVLLDAYYANGGSIPTDINGLNRLCRAFEDYERNAVQSVANQFFPVNGDGNRHNRRADRELQVAESAIEKMRKSGRDGANRRWGNDREPHREPHRVGYRVVDGVTIQPPTTNHHPPTTKEPTTKTNPHRGSTNLQQDGKIVDAQKRVLLKPESVDEKIWADFMAVRKAKRAPLTETALRGIEREARKANLSLQDVLAMCCERGWQGFKAEWVIENNAINGKASLAEKNKLALNQWLEDKRKEDEREIN